MVRRVKDHYLNSEDGLFTACVTCLTKGNTTVWSLPRKCECVEGFKCTVPAVNSCARCTHDTTTKKVKPKEQCCNTPDSTRLCYYKN
ncbi:TNF-alpha receptor like protein [NY_014 poxvirus]|uniref:TNF-alpha receptor like protein n=1 Tax=NY_014 poxvirus TaxID=2025360 RepID=UPI000B9A1735|nr:TNF-alpha receptor like protein [NY_014 poxvirus]AST09589.1 TNF-alpha receptor like protein [NY_014 poxvirus]